MTATKLQTGAKPVPVIANTDDWRAVKAAICEEATLLCAGRFRGRGIALVLTGSLARDEATAVREDSSWSLLGDAELLLVLADSAPLLSIREESQLRHDIEDKLPDRGIHCKVTLSSCHVDYLWRMRPHMFAYELRTCGQVVSGDPQILRFIPDFSSAQIPREDAWRLLCNRMVEHLGVASALIGKPALPPRNLLYHTVKLYLDMATSLLLFAGAYEPTYERRAAQLKALADDGRMDGSGPFPLRPFAERVDLCTLSKLRGLAGRNEPRLEIEPGGGWSLWEGAIAYLHQLWRWELSQMTGMDVDLSDGELYRAWMRCQSIPSRFRGWLCVLRRQGWLRSWPEWPRWAWRGISASPRYWIYGAASELFFRLPALVAPADKGASSESDSRELLRRLPAIRQPLPRNGFPNWQQVAAEIFWNYSEFAADTRS